MRDAVEFAAHAHHMLKDPALHEVWLNKLDDQAAWEKEFLNRREEIVSLEPVIFLVFCWKVLLLKWKQQIVCSRRGGNMFGVHRFTIMV
jgi:hypothetical protein